MKANPSVFWLIAAALTASGCGAPAAPPAASAAAGAANPAPQCAELARAGKIECYQPVFLATLAQQGVAGAMKQLERTAAADPDVQRDGHVYAHAIGISAYDPAAEVSTTFGRCSPAFQSGCYHGVIQAYFADLQRAGSAVDAASLAGLCEEQRGEDVSRWLLFQCVHGLGHGVTMFRGHDLPRALADCDLLGDPWEREGCYGGAFMENIGNATAPHHTEMLAGGHAHDAQKSAGDAEAGEHAAIHDEHVESGTAAEHHAGEAASPGHPAASTFEPLDDTDLHHPCSSLATRYGNACYAMQTSAVLFRNGGDIPATIGFCNEAPGEYRGICFSSLGRDISGRTVQDHGESARLCSLAPADAQTWCHVGVVKNFIDVTAVAADGLAYCASVPAGSNRNACYRAAGEEIWVLEPNAAARAAQCSAAGPAGAVECMRGAGIADMAR